MSNTLPPLGMHWSQQKNLSASSAVSLPPLSTWSDSYSSHSVLSSSPPRSSSPPQTPYSSRGRSQAYIQSSPTFGGGTFHHYGLDRIDEPSPFWDPFQSHLPSKRSNPAHTTLPSLKSIFPDSLSRKSMPLSSPLKSSLFNPEPVKRPSCAAQHHIPTPDESDEEEKQEEDEGYSFVEENTRATCFRTSAERGRWRYDPIPIKTEPRALLRQSAPTSSRAPIKTLNLNARPASEPAPSTNYLSLPVVSTNSHVDSEDVPELPVASYVDSAASDQLSPTPCNASLPSLTSDRESEEPDHEALSPLPPSSPPLSMYSAPTSPVVRPITPLSLSTSSPMRAPSMALLDQEIEEIALDKAGDPHIVSSPLSECLEFEDPAPPGHNVAAFQDPEETIREPASSLLLSEAIYPPDPLVVADTIQPPAIASAEPKNAIALIPIADIDIPQLRPPTAGDDPMNLDVSLVVAKDVESIASSISEVKGKGKAREQSTDSETSEHEDSHVQVKVKRKRHGGWRERRLEKKPRLTESNSVPRGVASSKASSSEKGSTRKEGKRQPVADDENQDSDTVEVSSSLVKRKKSRKTEEDRSRSRKRSSSISRSKPSNSAAPPFSPKPRSKAASKLKPVPPEEPVDPETRALHIEIQGMLIECMAMSRASTMPVSTLYKSVMQCRPSLRAQRPEKEWLQVFDAALRSSEAGRGSGVFGKVESSFKDDSNRALEAQWFYVPENDEDQERATLLRSMMPRPGKRSETKKYKQYYYRPLEKISRWDAEDDM